MKSRDFCYWLQGWFEINNPKSASGEVLDVIQKHLNLVFKHEIDPNMGNEAHQNELNNIHNIFPTTEEQAVAKWGPKPSPKHIFNMHGWYNPAHGKPRC